MNEKPNSIDKSRQHLLFCALKYACAEGFLKRKQSTPREETVKEIVLEELEKLRAAATDYFSTVCEIEQLEIGRSAFFAAIAGREWVKPAEGHP